jgi:hypothetical protein
MIQRVSRCLGNCQLVCSAESETRTVILHPDKVPAATPYLRIKSSGRRFFYGHPLIAEVLLCKMNFVWKDAGPAQKHDAGCHEC